VSRETRRRKGQAEAAVSGLCSASSLVKGGGGKEKSWQGETGGEREPLEEEFGGKEHARAAGTFSYMICRRGGTEGGATFRRKDPDITDFRTRHRNNLERGAGRGLWPEIFR